MVEFLPDSLKNEIKKETNNEINMDNIEKIRSVINKYLEKIIKASSLGQTKKGILTTGPKNSITYAISKLKKGRKK